MVRKHYFRVLCLLIILALVVAWIPPTAHAAGTEIKGKMINVVYDDSGSMVRSGGNYITRWSHAKYAMEVFCAMMGDNDVMNIFPMSKEGGLGLTVYGNDPNRVAAVHDMNGNYRNTPFTTVKSAAKNLMNADASYEKWLVIITDGAFDDGATPAATVQKALNDYNASGIKTVYLAIGDNASIMQSNVANGAYAEKASDGADVLKKVTSIANQIFSHLVLSNKYINTSGTQTSLKLDIPTNQIIVFAQGDNVSVGDLSLNGQKISATSIENVKCSDVIPSNYPQAVKDTSLKGVVVTFEAGDKPFESGDFSITVSNANTVEYYYSPGVVVNCELLYNGNTVQANDKLYAGDYQVEMNFINPLNNKEIQSDLLSSAKFTLTATNNDQVQTISDTKGTVTLSEGDVTISAVAELPGHVYLRSTKNYTVLPEPVDLKLEFTSPLNTLSPDMLGSNDSITILKAVNSKTGEPLTEAEWNVAEVSVAEIAGIKWLVEKGAECSTWNLKPTSASGAISDVEAGKHSFDVSVSYQLDKQYGFGSGAFAITMEEYAGNALKIEIAQPTGKYDLNAMDDPEGIVVTVFAENPLTGSFDPLSEDLWKAINLEASSEKRMGWKLTRGETTGTWLLTPSFFAGDPLLTDSGKITVSVSGAGAQGEMKYAGSGSQDIEVEPLSRINLIKLLAPRIIIAAFLLWLIIGYIKKKRIKTRGLNPRCRFKDAESPKRSINKDFFSVILPYVPEKATVRCHKSAFQCNFPDLRIQATGKRSFKIINKTLPLKTMKICGEFYSDMETLKKRNFALGSFDVTSVNPKQNNRSLGTFTFK